MNEPLCPRFKVILVGDSGVGKTSLAIRQCDKSFSYLVSSTIGASHMRTKVNAGGRDVELMIWDTAGQENLAPLVPMYMRGAVVCIVVASCLNVESCEHIRNWIDVVRQSAANPRMLLAFNKFDLVEDEGAVLQDIQANYTFGIDSVFYTSAKSGVNVEMLFEQAALEALDATSIDVREECDGSIDIDGAENMSGSCKC